MILCPNIGLTFHSTLHVSLYYSLFTVLCTFQTSWRRMYSVFYISIQLVQILVVLFSTDIMHLNSAQLFTELQLSMQCSSLLLQQCVAMCRPQQWSHISAKQLLLLLGWHSIRLQKACPIFQHAIWTMRRRRTNMIMMHGGDDDQLITMHDDWWWRQMTLTFDIGLSNFWAQNNDDESAKYIRRWWWWCMMMMTIFYLKKLILEILREWKYPRKCKTEARSDELLKIASK